MMRCIFAFALAAAICLPNAVIAAEPQLAHMVYFKLKESTGDAKEKLVVACKKYSSGHEGTVYFSGGVLAKDLDRDVNELDFDVSFNLVFRNKAAHDTYQTHPRHLKFIEENKDHGLVTVLSSCVGSDAYAALGILVRMRQGNA